MLSIDEMDAARETLIRLGSSERPGRWCTVDEGVILYTLVIANSVDEVLECGTANGYSTCWLALSGREVHTWDPVTRPKVWEQEPAALSALKMHINTYTAPFDVGMREIHTAPGKRLVFVDGDHSRGAFKQDLTAARDVAHPGDIIVLHDVRGYRWIGRELAHNNGSVYIPTPHGLGIIYV